MKRKFTTIKNWIKDKDFIIIDTKFSVDMFYIAILGYETPYEYDSRVLFGLAFGRDYLEIGLFWRIFVIK